METGLDGLDDQLVEGDDEDALIAALGRPTPDRLLMTAEALRFGIAKERIVRITRYDPWFVDRLDEIVTAEERVREQGLPTTPWGWLQLKKMGFGDARIAKLARTSESRVAAARRSHHAHWQHRGGRGGGGLRVAAHAVHDGDPPRHQP